MERNKFIESMLNGTGYKGSDTSLIRLVAKIAKDGSTYYDNVPLANGCLIGRRHIIRDNGADIEDKIELAVFADGRDCGDIEINRKDLENNLMQFTPLNFRPTVGGSSKAYIIDSIRAQSPNMESLTVYQHTGWRVIDKKPIFLHSNGAIGKENISVELNGRLAKYGFTVEDSETKWETLKTFLEIAPHNITYPLLAIAALSPLNEFLRQARIEPSFLLFLLGKTGTKKSTLAALTLCFFGEFDNKSLPGSSKDTGNSLEKTGFLLKDVLTVIDDFHPSMNRSDVSRMEQTAQAVCRMYGDRTGRNRMNADGSLRVNYPVRGNAILTGEDVPSIGQSGEARFLSVELTPESVNNTKLSFVQSKYTELNSCMRKYIEWLLPQYDKIPAALSQRFITLRDEAQNGGHGRVAEAVAHLQVAIEMWTLFLQKQGQLSEDESKEFRSESWEIFKQLAIAQNKAIAGEKPTTLFLNALKEMLSTQKVRLLPVDSGNLPDNGIGWKDDNYIYFIADTTYNAVCKFYRESDRSFPLSKRLLLKHLNVEKLIVPSDDNTKQKKIKGKNRRVVWLYADALEEKESS